MNSHAHVVLELPAPKEVSMIWDLNLSASFSSQHVSPGVGIVSRPPIRRLIDVVPVRFFRFSSKASCATLPVHRCSRALNAVELKVQILILKATVWYLMTPRAPHRGSLIATIPRAGQNFQCSALLP